MRCFELGEEQLFAGLHVVTSMLPKEHQSKSCDLQLPRGG
jgi:hypothetical protein